MHQPSGGALVSTWVTTLEGHAEDNDFTLVKKVIRLINANDENFALAA